MIDDIRPLGKPVVPAGGAQGAQPAQPAARVPETASPAGRRGDTVEISQQARAKLAESAAGALPPERVAELRQRILQGAYNTTDVIQAVAERILGSGDLAL